MRLFLNALGQPTNPGRAKICDADGSPELKALFQPAFCREGHARKKLVFKYFKFTGRVLRMMKKTMVATVSFLFKYSGVKWVWVFYLLHYEHCAIHRERGGEECGTG